VRGVQQAAQALACNDLRARGCRLPACATTARQQRSMEDAWRTPAQPGGCVRDTKARAAATSGGDPPPQHCIIAEACVLSSVCRLHARAAARTVRR
jgi:hypothetical protein